MALRVHHPRLALVGLCIFLDQRVERLFGDLPVASRSSPRGP